MKIFGFDISRAGAVKQAPFESVLMRLVASQDGMGMYGPGLTEFFAQYVTPDSCMRSPTVCAIVTAVSRRLSVSPVEVFKTVTVNTDTGGGEPSTTRVRRQKQPKHPVAVLLNAPNTWQTRASYWLDATSRLMRYGNYYAYLARGSTGPIRQLVPLHPRQMQVEQDLDTWVVTYTFNGKEVPALKIHHARGPARNALVGDSPIQDVNVSIGLEIAAETFGATFFNNGALPLMIFRYAQGMQAFKTEEQERQFIGDIQAAFTGSKRHRAMLLPKGIEVGDPVAIENDKAQFLETRKYQRTVIAGAFGVPPHLVGDLERATFNNVEQQSADFTINVVAPIAQWFESAMEADLLTQDDRNAGIIIRFNLDAAQRADFRSRQEGLLIQRNAGVISPNDWREQEGMNPIPDEDGGEDYIRPLNYVVAGSPADTGGGPLPATHTGTSEEPVTPKPAMDAAKQLLSELARVRLEVAVAMERIEAMAGKAMVPTITLNTPAPIVHVRPEIIVNPPAVNVPVHIEGTQVKVEAPQIHPQINIEQPAVTVPVQIEGTQIKVDAPAITVQPPAVSVPVQIEGTEVKVEQAAPQAMDLIPERDPETGRVVAIKHRPVKKTG